jgi:hypothetical protein
MFVFDRPRQDDYLLCATRRQRETTLCGGHVDQLPKQPAKPANFNPQPRAMRLIYEFRSEGASDEYIPRHVVRGCLAQRPRKRKQYRSRCKRQHCVSITHGISTGVYDEHS